MKQNLYNRIEHVRDIRIINDLAIFENDPRRNKDVKANDDFQGAKVDNMCNNFGIFVSHVW